MPAGASRLDVAIGNTERPRRRPRPHRPARRRPSSAQAADGDSEESVSIANPPAGTYTVEVDGYAVPAGTTAYDYRDVFYSTVTRCGDRAERRR